MIGLRSLAVLGAVLLGSTAVSAQVVPAQFLILVTCRSEGEQVELLEKFRAGGLECRALLS